jgi:hypothetical protein
MQATASVGAPVERTHDRPRSLVHGITLALWAVLAFSVVFGPDAVTSFWQWSQAQHPLLRGIGWVVFLPWMTALAAWESTWALWVRMSVVGVVAWATTFAVSPRT